MRAVVFHGPGDVRIMDVPEPVLPRGGLIVRPAGVGICGSDLKTWQTGNHRITGSQILGHEIAGTVTQSDDERYPPGTEVAVCPCAPCLECDWCQAGLQNMCARRVCLGYQIPGGMAEAVAVPVATLRTGGVVVLPPSIPVGLAAVAEPLHTVLNGQDRAGTRPGESVLVLGLGPIGVLHAAVAMSRGAAPVIGVDPSAARVTQAAAVLGERQVRLLAPGSEAETDEMVGGRGWDVVVVAAAADAAFATAIAVAAPMGRILAFAGVPASTSGMAVDMHRIHYQQLQIRGSFGGTPAYFRSAVRWLAEHELPLDRFVTDVVPLEDALHAFERLRSGAGLKTMLAVA